MKAVITIMFALWSTGASAQSLLKNEVDEFTGNRVVQSSFEQISHEGFSGRALVSAFYNEGQYAFVLTVQSFDSWQLLGANTVYFLIDGNRFEYTLHQMDTDISTGSTTEMYAVLLTEREFETFKSASSIRFRANRNVFELTDEAIAAFRIVSEALSQ